LLVLGQHYCWVCPSSFALPPSHYFITVFLPVSSEFKPYMSMQQLLHHHVSCRKPVKNKITFGQNMIVFEWDFKMGFQNCGRGLWTEEFVSSISSDSMTEYI